jgi:glycine amidinotransferase/scyllo-inosamine-4-phosphate amidinotransferase 1
MASKNEWDPLQDVIVGDATGARIPQLDISLRLINYADVTDENDIPQGLYPQQVIDEANEDLELFRDVLRKENVNVLRPDASCEPQYYHYCPRDGILVHDDLILATPQPLRARRTEYRALEDILNKYGALQVAECSQADTMYNPACLGDPDVLALNETEPCFDAANILRDNDNLYYLVSNSGNKAGARYLQELCPTKKVYTIEDVYAYMHLDSTISLLREGLMLLNPSRIKSIDQLPKPLQSWDYIWCPDPGEVYHYPGYCNSSKWINVNLLMINPNLAVIESNQHALRVELEKHHIESAMIQARHQRTLGGGFHCVTLDLERKHG